MMILHGKSIEIRISFLLPLAAFAGFPDLDFLAGFIQLAKAVTTQRHTFKISTTSHGTHGTFSFLLSGRAVKHTKKDFTLPNIGRPWNI
ncbi:hypothetical protein V8F20_008722 [Naviculisporaceae sp. PSN 640]